MRVTYNIGCGIIPQRNEFAATVAVDQISPADEWPYNVIRRRISLQNTFCLSRGKDKPSPTESWTHAGDLVIRFQSFGTGDVRADG